MKKRKSLFSLIAFLSVAVSFAPEGNAIDPVELVIVPSPAGVFPEMDPIQAPMNGFRVGQETFNSLTETAGTAQNILNDSLSGIQKAVGTVKGAINDLSNPLAFVNKLASSAFQTCQIKDKNGNTIKVDVSQKETVAEGVYAVIMTRPEFDLRYDFENNVNRFQADSITEIYTAVDMLQSKMESEIKPAIEKTKSSLESNGTQGAICDRTKALDALDDALKVLQNATALRAQLAAVKAMNTIEPLKFDSRFDGKENKSETHDEAFLFEIPNTHSISGKTPLAFAQLKEKRELQKAVAKIKDSATGQFINMTADGASKDAVLKTMERSARIKDTLEFQAKELQNKSTKVELSEKDVEDLSPAVKVQAFFRTKGVSYSTAPASGIMHPYVAAEEKMNELNKVDDLAAEVDDASSAHNTINGLPSYKKAAQRLQEVIKRHEKTIEELKSEQQSVLEFLGRRYDNPLKVMQGQTPPTDITAYDQMKGLGGWAVAAFEAAKAAQATTDVTGDIVMADVETDFDSNNDNYAGQIEKNEIADNISKRSTSIGSPSKEEAIAEENRATIMIPWTIGAEVSKMMAAAPQEWGIVKQKFPIWNDTKKFYDQYLDGKYKNIRTVLHGFSVNDVKAVVVAHLQGKKNSPSDTLKQQEFSRLDGELNKSRIKYQEEYDAKHKEHAQEIKRTETSLQKQRAQVAEELEKASETFKNLNDEIYDTREEIRTDSIKKIEKNLLYKEEFPDVFQEVRATVLPAAGGSYYAMKIKSGFSLAMAYLKSDGGKALKADISSAIKRDKRTSDVKVLQQKSSEADKKISELKAKLSALDAQVAREKLNSQKGSANINASLVQKSASAIEQIKKAKSEYEEKFSKDVNQGLSVIASNMVSKLVDVEDPVGLKASLLGGLNAAIEKALSDLYTLVDARIDMAQSQLKGMGDNLYDPDYHGQVVQIHQQMIDDIKKMPLVVKHGGMKVALDILLYETMLSADVSPEGEDYFVGNPAKTRDLKAPMVVPGLKLPPLREIVRFDDVDFQNIKPYDKDRKDSEPITRNDFLNYGQEIPAIWQMLLKERAFVETDINLKELLKSEGECPTVALFRGGYMPCKVKNSSVVVDVNAKGDFIEGNSTVKDLRECPYLEIRKGKVYDVLRSAEISFLKPTLWNKDDAKPVSENCVYSELGTLLDADSNGTIFFRQETYDAFQNLIARQAEDVSGDSNKDQPPLKKAYDNAVMTRNKIGEYLQFVENEQNARRHKEEVQKEYDELMKTLKEVLAKHGLAISGNLDMAKDSDYEKVRGKLERLKNTKVAESLKKMDNIQIKENEVAAERVDYYKNIVRGLQKDKDELTPVTAAVVDNNNLDADIKTAKVNDEVVDKYSKHLEELGAKSNFKAMPYYVRY